MENNAQNEQVQNEQQGFGDTMLDALIGGVATGACLAAIYGTARLGITLIDAAFNKVMGKQPEPLAEAAPAAAPVQAEKKGRK